MLSLKKILQPVHGYGSPDPVTFVPIKDSELFFAEDKEINLTDIATDNKILSGSGKTSVKGKQDFVRTKCC